MHEGVSEQGRDREEGSVADGNNWHSSGDRKVKRTAKEWLVKLRKELQPRSMQ